MWMGRPPLTASVGEQPPKVVRDQAQRPPVDLAQAGSRHCPGDGVAGALVATGARGSGMVAR